MKSGRTTFRVRVKTPGEKTFAQAFCEQNGISSARFERAVLSRAFHPHARWLVPLLCFFQPGFCDADIDLVREAGRLRGVEDFDAEAKAFAYHPANTGFARRVLNARVSTRRLRHMIRDTLPAPDAEGAVGR
ncbi:hypothetical protein OpiT1DRAFT_01331 [Opitutaceae bacterium TAV1]|nr:hypothetical protein OpiT1DRAFT_01331 [Opitutaceae bacterium TAV1]